MEKKGLIELLICLFYWIVMGLEKASEILMMSLSAGSGRLARCASGIFFKNFSVFLFDIFGEHSVVSPQALLSP